MRKLYKSLLIFAAIAAFIGLTVYLIFHLVPVPPKEDVTQARKALTKAMKSRANTYSKEFYKEAGILYDSALIHWENQNKRFIYFRNYEKVKSCAQLSLKIANQANNNSKHSTSTFKSNLKEKLTSLKKLEQDIITYFNRFPLPNDVRNNISTGRLLLSEGEIDYQKGLYLTASKKLNNASEQLTFAYNKASADLVNYFESYTLWKKWTEKAINDSKIDQSYAIIVDKLSRKCLVYFNGIKKYEFDVELGMNWVGDKKKMGDKATPEGMYKIISKFSGTKYNNALLLDYPNSEDKEQFNIEKSKGLIPHTAKIGGGIEIHGSGGKGVDWTEGCIALNDSEMDVIYRIATVGTPVTIVGSMRNIQQIFKR